MKINILLSVIFMAVSVYAETYRWVDKDGITYFTDYPPPEAQTPYEEINKDEYFQDNVQEDFHVRGLEEQTENSQHSDLTEDDIKFIELLKKQGVIPEDDPFILTHGELEQFKKMLASEIDLNMLYEPPDPRFSSPEKAFKLYRESLIKGELEIALDCLTPYYGNKQKEMFQAMGKKTLKEIGEHMREIERISQDGRVAEYRIKRNENGQEITYYMYFVKYLGNWKIDRF